MNTSDYTDILSTNSKQRCNTCGHLLQNCTCGMFETVRKNGGFMFKRPTPQTPTTNEDLHDARYDEYYSINCP
jgi:hypothetical protein